MTMIKAMLTVTLASLTAGWGVSYFAASYQGEASFQLYKEQVQENINNRRARVCREVEGALPESSELAVNIISDEIEKMNRRKAERRQENESY